MDPLYSSAEIPPTASMASFSSSTESDASLTWAEETASATWVVPSESLSSGISSTFDVVATLESAPSTSTSASDAESTLLGAIVVIPKTPTPTPTDVRPPAPSEGQNTGVIVGSVFAFTILLGICTFFILRHRRRSRPNKEEEALSYRQLPSPQSPDTMFKPEPSGLDWGASLEAGQEGYREPVPEPPKGKILRSFFMKQPEMQLRGAGSAAAGQQSSANQPGELPTSHSEVVLDDCVKVTMLDDDSDTDDTGLAPIRLSVPPIPKLHTTFSLGSTASSNDDDDDEEEPETVVVSTLSPSKNKGKEKAPQEDPYAGEIIRDMRTETLMIGHADVRFGSAYLASFATDDENGVGSPSTLRLTTSTAYLGSQDTSMVQSFSTKVSQDQIAMIPSMEASEATSKDSLSMERAAVVELEAIPSLNGPVASDVPDATMPATTETSAAASNDRLMPTAAAPKHRNILTNPGSGLSDLLSLYAGMSEDGEQVRSELGEDWEDDDDDLKPLSRLQNPDSPIPTHRQLGRKGTNRTVHEVQGVTLVRRITGKQAVQSGAGSMLIADQDLEAITVDRDMSEGDTANKKFVDGGHSISFIDTVDDEFRDQ